MRRSSLGAIARSLDNGVVAVAKKRADRGSGSGIFAHRACYGIGGTDTLWGVGYGLRHFTLNEVPPMPNAILGTAPLGRRWPTLDPFLFCVHHVDEYPRGNANMGIDARELRGR